MRTMFWSVEIHTHLAGGVEGGKGIIASFPPDYVTAPGRAADRATVVIA